MRSIKPELMKKKLTPKIICSVLFFCIVLFLWTLSSCTYYKVQTVSPVTVKAIHQYDSLNKYFILHQGDSAWHLSVFGHKEDQISGYLEKLPPDHVKYLYTEPGKGARYKNTFRHDESGVLDEVHLFVQDSLVPGFHTGDHITLNLSAITKAYVNKKDKGRTAGTYIASALGITVGVAGVVVLIVALTKSSCPFIYVKNNNDFSFAGEIFGGAVYSSLERHDYLPLPGFHSESKKYTLKITNGLPEIQYINLAELWIVRHPVNVDVLPDRQGIMHAVSQPEAPTEAISSASSDLLPLVTTKDQRSFLFDEEPSRTGDTCGFNKVFLTFSVPGKPDTGKLIVRAGNSVWGDYTYGEFTKLFGNKYNLWVKKQGKEPAEKNLRWKLDQRFVMMVYLETETGWQFVDYFDLIGPLGARDLIMPVDLTRALITDSPDHGKTVRVKLESGFKFWELDYAAMDFSGDGNFTIDRVKPFSAITESGRKVTQALAQDDAHYYIQENTGEEGLVVFQDSPDQHGMKKSVFLHTKGYYEHVRNYPNPPDKKLLETFVVPGKFSRFSYDNYVVFTKNNYIFAEDPRLP